ncbi:MAG: 50S ribosomal protein L15 [Candidatus Omnitrophota bacterium]
MFNLSQIKPPRGLRKRRKIVGRGVSSGHGKTSCRGQKGQRARAGRDFWLGFEGGQMPLIRRIPKRGFTSKFKKIYQVVNVNQLTRFTKDSIVDPNALKDKNLIQDQFKLVKILGNGKFNKALTVKAHAFSEEAKKIIEAAGGKIELVK